VAKSPSEVLKKTKKVEKGDKGEKKKDGMLSFIARHKRGEKEEKSGGDVGKHNNGKTTGFKAVEKRAEKEYGSKEAGEKVAGAVLAKMKKAHKL
jgi:hypothetical protein